MKDTVAVIGAGPAGLVAARWLKHVGLQPTLFEQAECGGGQWGGRPGLSGVWPSMRTNTSRAMTAFSDLDHETGTPVYPTNQAMRAYLERYARKFDLASLTRCGTRVLAVEPAAAGNGWAVTVAGDGMPAHEEVFSRVLVANGRFHRPSIPDIAGLSTFSGRCGVSHTFDYKQPDRYRGQRVLVAGCAVSALEIACDLAALGAAHVVTANRRQRYVIQKLMAGVPAEYLLHTRYAALADESLPRDVVGADLKKFVTRTSGSPEQFGAPKPDDDVLKAAITQCQYYLPFVAEGRIEPKPWIERVDGRRVQFADDSSQEFDGLLFGTGFELDLPFFREPIRSVLAIDAQHIDLHKHTFHPELPGLAFLGMFQVAGPYWPPIELQARWIAYVWSGVRPPPSDEQMHEGIAAYRARRGQSQLQRMAAVTVDYAREAGVEPDVAQWPGLAHELLFGPLSPASFRLSGPDAMPDAASQVLTAAHAFGGEPAGDWTPEQLEKLRVLADARRDDALAALCSSLSGPAVLGRTDRGGADQLRSLA